LGAVRTIDAIVLVCTIDYELVEGRYDGRKKVAKC
jgi:hypothetical protein